MPYQISIIKKPTNDRYVLFVWTIHTRIVNFTIRLSEYQGDLADVYNQQALYELLDFFLVISKSNKHS